MESDTGRLETFADGVIAIAITLLILEVKVPPVGGEQLASAVVHAWPSYAGYVVSFLTIGVIWVNHHHMFKLIGRTTHAFLILNVVFLMTIAFGAKAVLIGRPYAFALAANGAQGVADCIAILREELETALALLGCPSIAEVDRSVLWT